MAMLAVGVIATSEESPMNKDLIDFAVANPPVVELCPGATEEEVMAVIGSLEESDEKWTNMKLYIDGTGPTILESAATIGATRKYFLEDQYKLLLVCLARVTSDAACTLSFFSLRYYNEILPVHNHIAFRNGTDHVDGGVWAGVPPSSSRELTAPQPRHV